MSRHSSNHKPESSPEITPKENINLKRLLIDFVIELIIYGGLVLIYYFLVLRFLSSPLVLLYDRYLPLYAFAALILIVAQGVVLESITSFLLSKLGLSFHE
jgi:hypothetical protein